MTSNPLDTEKQHFSVPEVADIIGVSRKHIYECIREGLLRAYDFTLKGCGGARSIRISKESIQEFIKDREINPQKYFE